jgi:methionine biosynthesis protein MetW
VICDLIEEAASVLDLGCGDGTLLATLVAQRKVRASGIDISEEALRLARNRGLTDLQLADLSSPEFVITDEYHYITITEVIEHIPNPEDVLAKVRGHFRKALIVSVPNVGYYTHRIRLLFGRFPLQWGKHPAQHLRFWTVHDFRWWIELQGYRITKTVPPAQGFPLLYILWPSLFADQIVSVIEAVKTKQGKV